MRDAASTTTAYNIMQVMSRLGICRDAVYRAIRSGELFARTFGKRTSILESDLEAFTESLPRLGGDEAGDRSKAGRPWKRQGVEAAGRCHLRTWRARHRRRR
jgi:hypothetical protein